MRGRRGRHRMMMGQMMDPRSRFFMAIASDQRIKIIEALRSGEKSSSELINLLQLDPSVVSRHLMMLRNAGLINARKEGVSLFFAVADKRLFQIIDVATEMIKDWLTNFQDFFK